MSQYLHGGSNTCSERGTNNLEDIEPLFAENTLVQDMYPQDGKRSYRNRQRKWGHGVVGPHRTGDEERVAGFRNVRGTEDRVAHWLPRDKVSHDI